ncbi:MAG: rhomboid family intramembrane serine protease GlpG [Colwellia sp.]|nr:rhomboid family intramembrane serine protease GlpG [Colwellia sp.]
MSLSADEQLVALVSIKQHNIALLFSNYLLSINIEAKLENEDDGFVLYCQSDKFTLAKEAFDEFIQQPHHQKYQQAAWHSGEVTQINNDHPSLISNFKEQFFAHAGIVTLVVFSACWLVFIGSLLGWQRTIFSGVQFYHQLGFNDFIAEPWRLLGPAFFHFSWLHIAFNSMWWWQLGGSIERILGKGALINLFLISAIFSNLGQFIVSGPNFGGLSGVVYGLVGYVWWYGWLAPEKGLFISKPIIGFLLFWLLLGFADFLPVNMANTAHLLGLISGCALAAVKIRLMKRG